MFKPEVDKKILIALSGVTWSVIGIMLCTLAATWLLKADSQKTVLLGLAGIFLSILIHHFGFLRLADRNIERILSKEGKVCIFAFQAWKSYMIIVVMVGIGIALRSSSLPRYYLSIIYIGFGGAMILSSIRYHRVFIQLLNKS